MKMVILAMWKAKQKLIKTDGDFQAMYYLFRKHHWKPSDYMKMSYLQRMVVRGFIIQECEDIKAETEELEEAANGK